MEQYDRRLEVLSLSEEDVTCRTFVLKDEDHTFGNALQYIINKNPDVEFCAYSVPHPSIHNINLRVQTRGLPATEVFRKGLEDLQVLCEHMISGFHAALTEYKDTKLDEVEKTD